jgi:nickel-dependent lactate racemase
MLALSPIEATGSSVSTSQISDLVSEACPSKEYRGKQVLLVVPDGTRTAPVGLLFKELFKQIGEATLRFDVLVALGTHQPMSDEAICRRLDITDAEWREFVSKGPLF